MTQSRLDDSFLELKGWAPPDTVIASAGRKSLRGFDNLRIVGLQVEMRAPGLHHRHPVPHVAVVVKLALLAKVQVVVYDPANVHRPAILQLNEYFRCPDALPSKLGECFARRTTKHAFESRLREAKDLVVRIHQEQSERS